MASFLVSATWDDVPHLNAAAKADLLASIPPFQRDARSKGIPQLGAGAIFPIPESDISLRDFPIPDHWPRGYGLDVGWNWTAAAWIAHDRESDIRYLIGCQKRADAEPSVHAAGIRGRGEWIPGRIDPAANGRSQLDGRKLIESYRGQGLKLENADNAVESGLLLMWTLMTEGRLKVFASCSQWFEEYRLYRRDEKGRVVKKFDHLIDASRYALASGVEWLETPPPAIRKHGTRSAFGASAAAPRRGWAS